MGDTIGNEELRKILTLSHALHTYFMGGPYWGHEDFSDFYKETMPNKDFVRNTEGLAESLAKIDKKGTNPWEFSFKNGTNFDCLVRDTYARQYKIELIGRGNVEIWADIGKCLVLDSMRLSDAYNTKPRDPKNNKTTHNKRRALFSHLQRLCPSEVLSAGKSLNKSTFELLAESVIISNGSVRAICKPMPCAEDLEQAHKKFFLVYMKADKPHGWLGDAIISGFEAFKWHKLEDYQIHTYLRKKAFAYAELEVGWETVRNAFKGVVL